ncbi:MAG: NADH-quinone oxidoreductase subunit C, partial [Rudaea sp.]
GLDHGPEAGGTIEVLYTFCDRAAVVTLRVPLPRQNPKVGTLRAIIPPAVLFERELSEMFGIAIEGETDDVHEFLSDDWPAGSYPLRKDWKAETGLPGRAEQIPHSGADDGHQADA